MPRLVLGLLCCMVALASSQASARGDASSWTVLSDQPVITRQIVVEHRGARLVGTLYLPVASSPVGTLIALHGAQSPLRGEALYRHLTQVLPRLGMAVFLYDRRGSGASTSGGAAPGNFDLLAEDAVAALRRLAREPGIDPDRIGFWGLSQGGWLALLAAQMEQRAAFAVAASAPMASADVQMNFAVRNILSIKGRTADEVERAIAARSVVDDYRRGKRTRTEAERAEASISNEPWYDYTWIKGNIDDPEWPRQIRSDPLRSLRGSRVPTLLLFGQADPWVPVNASLTALRRERATLKQVTVRVIDGADHSMMLGVPPSRQIDPSSATTAAPNAPAYFALLGAWLASTLRIH